MALAKAQALAAKVVAPVVEVALPRKAAKAAAPVALAQAAPELRSAARAVAAAAP